MSNWIGLDGGKMGVAKGMGVLGKVKMQKSETKNAPQNAGIWRNREI
jgi:hypothetical protein